MTRPFKACAALSAILVILTLVGLLLATAWYRDGVCEIEAWKCDAGGLGLGLVYVCVLPAFFLGSVALLMVIAGRHRS